MYKRKKEGGEQLRLYDLKVSMEVALNVFLHSDLAFESLELERKEASQVDIQKKKLNVLKAILKGRPFEQALEEERVNMKLIPHAKSLKDFPVSRAGVKRV